MILLNWLHSVLYSTILTLAALHPVHISVTDIEFDEKEKSLEIMSRVFMDDLEKTMRDRYQSPELDILNPKVRTIDDMMREYFTEKMKISLDGKAQKINYLGHETDGEAFVFYIEVTGVRKWKEIQVTNTTIMETHDDQSNLVHVNVRGKLKSMRLTRNNQTDKLSFDQK